jgi:dihydrofolate reductase|tara:strand:- start:475 stop:957 length:483 start_codon:yes stop_codon:yes gene_type:complete
MKIHLIWAQDKNGGIGYKGQLPWHIPEDLQNFKKLTLNSTILMGRKTWESLPIKPLPKRRNIVLTSNKNLEVESYQSIDECLIKLKNDNIDKLYIIGGSKIYNSFIDKADQLHITLVDEKTKNIDTIFPLTIDQFEKEFKKIKENKLAENVTYSNWCKVK